MIELNLFMNHLDDLLHNLLVSFIIFNKTNLDYCFFFNLKNKKCMSNINFATNVCNNAIRKRKVKDLLAHESKENKIY